MNVLQISVDPCMELLSMLQLMAGDHRLSGKNCTYKDEASDWFKPFSEHPGVQFYKSIMGHFCYDAPINSMHLMHFTTDLELIAEPTAYLLNRAEGKENWMQFYHGLQAFAKDSKFLEFWVNHQEYYISIVDKLKNMLSSFDIPNELESYFRMNFESYSFISSPLQDGGYGGGQPHGNAQDISCTIGYDPYKQSGWDELGLRDFLWHEFGHGFVNPIVDAYLNENEMNDCIILNIAKSLQNDDQSLYQGAYLQEGIVRAITHRLMIKHYGQNIGDDNREKCETFGYEYIHLLMNALKKYESARDLTHISFDAYLPILMKDIVNSLQSD